MKFDPIRRIVTGHNAAGDAVVTDDGFLEGVLNPVKSTQLTTVWTTSGSPVDNDDPTDGRSREVDLTNPGGTVIRVVDLLPGRASPMHRTSSIDYGIVISGEVELVLDHDAVSLVKPGEIVIQRGTIHAWRNPSADTTARIVFVLLDAKPVTVDGQPLRDIHPRETGHLV